MVPVRMEPFDILVAVGRGLAVLAVQLMLLPVVGTSTPAKAVVLWHEEKYLQTDKQQTLYAKKEVQRSRKTPAM